MSLTDASRNVAQQQQTRYRSLEQKLTNRLDTHLTEDAARSRGHGGGRRHGGSADEGSLLSADAEVHLTVHHVCVQSFESGLLLMLEGWQAVQEADWEGGTSLVSVTFSTAWPNSWSHCCLHRCWPWTLSLAGVLHRTATDRFTLLSWH